jgi:hypothetical protein
VKQTQPTPPTRGQGQARTHKSKTPLQLLLNRAGCLLQREEACVQWWNVDPCPGLLHSLTPATTRTAIGTRRPSKLKVSSCWMLRCQMVSHPGVAGLKTSIPMCTPWSPRIPESACSNATSQDHQSPAMGGAGHESHEVGGVFAGMEGGVPQR